MALGLHVAGGGSGDTQWLAPDSAVNQSFTIDLGTIQFDKVEIFRPSHLQSLISRYNAKLRPIFVDEPNFRNSNGAIDARTGRRPLWHVAGLDTKGPPLVDYLLL